MIKETKRKSFSFYRSYYDVFNELSDKDKLVFIKALLDKEFLDIEPKDLTGMVKFAWISQYNSIDQQVKGYKSKTKDPMQGGCQGGGVRGEITPSLQEKEKEKEKEQLSITPTTSEDNINFDVLLNYIVDNVGRKFTTINQNTRKKYKARLKDGYTKENIFNAINNCVNDSWHKEQNYKYLTPLYFSQEKTLETYGTKVPNKERKAYDFI